MQGRDNVEFLEDLGIAVTKRVRRNDEIEATEVRVIGSDGEQAGVMGSPRRLNWPKTRDWTSSKFRRWRIRLYAELWILASTCSNRTRNTRSAKRKQKQVHVKEIKFRPGTDEGDYQIKLRKLMQFLEDGDKTKVTLRFRGREMAHKELGAQLLARVRDDLEEYGTVEQMPQMEGRQMVMVIAPKKH